MLVGTLLVRGAKGLLSLSLVLPISPISLRSQQGSTFPSGPSWEMALCGPGWLVGAAYPAAEGARHKPGVAGGRDVCRGRPTGSRKKSRAVEGLPSGPGTQCSESADSVITIAPRVSSQYLHFADGEMEAPREGAFLRARCQGSQGERRISI